MKVLVNVRLEKEIYQRLKLLAGDLGWTLSDTIRYPISILYSLLHPDIMLDGEEVIEFIRGEMDKKGQIPVHKIYRYIEPRAEEQLREGVGRVVNRSNPRRGA